MKQKVFHALAWIINILNKHKIDYTISGGLGASFYGSDRPINDIDIDIPEGAFNIILDDVKQYVVWGPARYKNPRWDLLLLRLNFHGQDIDLGGASDTKLYHAEEKKWVNFVVDLSKKREFVIDKLKVQVMDPHELIAYKKILSRDCDRKDIRAIKEFGKNNETK